MMSRRFPCAALAVVAVVGFASAASAADMAIKAPQPPRPVAAFDWSGFYVGAHVGGGWKSNSWIEPGTNGIPAGTQTASYNATGLIGGGQAGYNYQRGWAVFGIEGEISGSGIKGEASCFPELPAEVQTCSTNVKWMATVTGRFGVAFDRTLVYVKGGYAWARENLANPLTLPLPPVTWQTSDNRGGGTVGIGVEYGFTPNWSAKVEYDYIDFGTHDVGFPSPAPGVVPFNENVRQKVSLVKVGINYRFGGPIW